MSIKELLEETAERGDHRGGDQVWLAAQSEVEASIRKGQRVFRATVVALGLLAVAAVSPLLLNQGSESVAEGGSVAETVAPAHGDNDHGSDRVGGFTKDPDDRSSRAKTDTTSPNNGTSIGQESNSDEAGSEKYESAPDCPLGQRVPLGQANPTTQAEPMGAVWCFDQGPAPEPTRVQGDNSWIDDFTYGGDLRRFEDGDLGYRIYNQAGENPPEQATHWLNHNHWMVDSTGAFSGGSSMRPDQAFRFEDGKLVVEADVAAAVPEFDPSHWVEITITDAAEPTSIVDGLYAYGQFGDDHSIGCRLQPSSVPVCAQYGSVGSSPSPGCSQNGERILEISFFQQCGETTGGGEWAKDPTYPDATAADFMRACEPNQTDLYCRDRFRMEVSGDSLSLFVNGFKMFESKDWPEDKQLPSRFLDGDVYVYFSSWSWRSEGELVRFHWDRLAVNPDQGLTTAPSFCVDRNDRTCESADHH